MNEPYNFSNNEISVNGKVKHKQMSKKCSVIITSSVVITRFEA